MTTYPFRARRLLGLLLSFVLTATPALAHQQQTGYPGRPDVVGVSPEDPEMAAAVARARAELPDFFGRHAAPAPGERDFVVKFDLGGTGEMIWAGALQRDNDRLSGILSNQPLNADYRQGQRVDIPEEAIIDWAFVRDGRAQGHHTTRVLLSRVPPEQAAQVRAALGW